MSSFCSSVGNAMFMATLPEAAQKIVKPRKVRRKDGHRVKDLKTLTEPLALEIQMATALREPLETRHQSWKSKAINLCS